MAVTFKTKACADVTMLDASAKQVLGLIGKEFSVRGVITAAEAPGALAKIAAAVAAQGGDRGPDEESDPEGARAHVPLKTRLAPFVEMLERAHAGGRDILWGV